MKAIWTFPWVLLSGIGAAHAQANPTAPVPEPEMWALIAVVAVAFGISRIIGRK